MKNYDSVIKILSDTKIIPVVKINKEEDAIPLANALVNGGLPAVEVTFRSEQAAQCIKLISENVPNIFVCAGTVLTVEQAQIAKENGAKAIISPGFNPLVVDWCNKNDIPVFPGCATPSEVEGALNMGLKNLKLFPAEVVGGVGMLKALYGPYSFVKFMPTGGVSLKNVKEYLALPNVIACGGTWICPENLLNEGDFSQIEKLAMEAASFVRDI